MDDKKKNLVVPFEIVPEKIADMTISQLIKRDNAEIKKKKNMLSVTLTEGNATISMDIVKYGTGQSFTGSMFSNSGPKKNYRDDILAMRKKGISQTDIARRLGISQSYVSKLCSEK